MRKKVIAVTLMLAASSLPLLVLGQTLPRPVLMADADKICIRGYVTYGEDRGFATEPKYLFASFRLSRHGNPLIGAIVRVQDRELVDMGDGRYLKSIRDIKLNHGDMVRVTADFSRISRVPIRDGPYSGPVNVADYRVANTIQWVFPTHNLRFDLAAYPLGLPLRWHCSGRLSQGTVRIYKKGSAASLRSEVHGEEFTVPVGTLSPGNTYNFMLTDQGYSFNVSRLFASSSAIGFTLENIIIAETNLAK